jgi:CRISPR/Cas system-associated endonuclease/helicase Cas3
MTGKNVILKMSGNSRYTPLRSKTWREKARQIGKRIKNLPGLQHYGTLDNLFTLHLARMSLMLADHVYSSQPHIWGGRMMPARLGQQRPSVRAAEAKT